MTEPFWRLETGIGEEGSVAWDPDIDGHTDSVTAVSKDKHISKWSNKSKDKEAGNKDGI